MHVAIRPSLAVSIFSSDRGVKLSSSAASIARWRKSTGGPVTATLTPLVVGATSTATNA